MIMQMLKDFWTILRSDYLVHFWWLALGYVGAYGLAHVVSRVGGSDGQTILFQCRKGWGIAFLLHALASSCVIINWYLQNGMFASFWRFFPFYLLLLIADLFLAFGLFASRQRYVSYIEWKPH